MYIVGLLSGLSERPSLFQRSEPSSNSRAGQTQGLSALMHHLPRNKMIRKNFLSTSNLHIVQLFIWRVMNWYNATGSQEIPHDIDTSEYLFPGRIWVVRPAWEVGVKVASLAPIVLLGLVGNGSLVHAILRTKSLHSTTNLFILNMAVADLGTHLLCPWMFVCVDIFQNYILGEVGCKFDGFLLQAMTLVAVISLSAVSFDRVCAIVLNCPGKLSVRSARLLILVSWIIALIVAVPLAIVRQYHERQWKNYRETFCTETVTAYPYWHICVGLSVWTPLGIMAVCYSTILIKLDRYECQALKSKHPIVVKYKGRVARILALIVLAFIICRVPFTALVIRRAQMKNADEFTVGQAGSMYVLWYVSRYLVFVNATLNPLLYGCTGGSLRRALVASPPLSWIIRKKKLAPKTFNQTQNNRSKLKPRGPCIRVDSTREVVPNISSAVQYKTTTGRSESRLYKKFRINSIVK